MKLGHRVRWLERRHGVSANGRCAECGGQGTPAVFMSRSADQLGTPKGGCLPCGKASLAALVVIPAGPGENPAWQTCHGVLNASGCRSST